MSRFSVLEKLADGAAVELFLGRANDTGARLVLEALRLELSGNSEVLRRVHTEAKLRESLQHPALAKRSHAFRSSLGRHFWISEPVSGETLRKYLSSDHKLSPKDAIRFLLPLCEAVSYLHQRGLTHGCISPEYVLLDGSGTNLRGKLLDTGLSLLRISDRALKAAPGRIIVRPEYLSPERIRGTRGTSSSDIYSLGVLLYELICGVAPYRDSDVNQTRQKHLTAPLPRLPAGAEFLEPVLNGCLAKVPSARFDTVEALHHALVKAESATPLPRAAQGAHVSPSPAPVAMASSYAPQQLGTYDVLKRLGEGATGQVYLGRHRRIDRHVAIKLLRGEHAQNKEMVARFFQEAKAANKVQHPHIAEVYDCVDETTLDGVAQCYLVMEYLEGTTLGQLIRREPLPLVRAITLVRQICSALEAVHRAGVVHRDIKPDNIFVITREGKDWVKLVDFGIAKLSWDAEAEAEGRLTAHGEMLGTPSYMAPEQLSAKDVDARADIYAVGTVLYRILAGKLPFDGKSIGEVLVALIRSPPPALPPTTASGEPLPVELRQLVMRCLEKSAAKRPSSMAELSQLLAPFERAPLPDEDEPISTSGFEIIDDLSESMDQSDEDLGFADVEIDSPRTPLRPPRVPLEGHYFARRAATAFAKTETNEVVLFVPTEDRLEQGIRVRLRMSFGDCNEAFELDGVLKTGSVTIGPAKLRGVYVSFERDQKVRAEAILAFCNGKPIAGGVLASPRVDVKIPCRAVVGAAKYEGFVLDLSRTGAFITAGTLSGLNPGTKVEIQLEPGPGPQAIGLRTLQGVIVWRGNKNGTAGFAVKFLTSPAGSQAVLNHYLGRIA